MGGVIRVQRLSAEHRVEPEQLAALEVVLHGPVEALEERLARLRIVVDVEPGGRGILGIPRLEHRHEDVGLGREVPDDGRLHDAAGVGDLLDRDVVEAVLRDEGCGHGDDLGPTSLGREAPASGIDRRSWGSTLVTNWSLV